MFLLRTDTLRQKIQFCHLLSQRTSDELLNSLRLDQQLDFVKDFLRNDILNFATQLTDNMLRYKLIDFEFLQVLYDFDRNEYERIFVAVLTKYNQLYDIETIEKITPGFHYLDQSVICFEWQYDQINTFIRITKQDFDLSKNLAKLYSEPTLQGDVKQRVVRMLKHLPLNIECLSGTPRVVISNFGNGLFLKSEKVDDYYALAFDFEAQGLSVHAENATENSYELHDGGDLVLCLGPASSSTKSRASFCPLSNALRGPRKWILKLYHSNDPCKGYIIKAEDCDAYLCSNPFQDFKRYVQMKETVDEDQLDCFIWKFQLYVG